MPCHQTVLRLNMVELASLAVGLIAGPFGRELEHREVTPVVGIGLGQRLGGGGPAPPVPGR
jgi:hypothetical protein